MGLYYFSCSSWSPVFFWLPFMDQEDKPMGIPKSLPRAKSGLWLTKDNKLVAMHANMTATTYKLTNYFRWRAQQENKLEGLSVDCRTIIKDSAS